MNIVHIAAELAPVAKVGGLGDVLFGLCAALCDHTHKVEVCIPKYDCLDLSEVHNLTLIENDFPSFFNGTWHKNRVWQGTVESFDVLFFESLDSHNFFNRKTIYGCVDDSDRFLYFNRLVLEYLYKRDSLPHILHIHDWHAAAIPLLQKMLFPQPLPKTVLTIHNLAYQGITPAASLKKAGIPEAFFQSQKEKEFYNLLKEGIEHSDWITTVSPTYADEILTPIGGKGLHDVLNKHKNKFSGILNGIDEKFWNPQTDSSLPYRYSIKDIVNHTPLIENKRKAKQSLLKMFSLSESDKPLIGCVTRLVAQKGPDLIQQAIYWSLEHNVPFVLLGSTSEPDIWEQFLQIKKETDKSPTVHIELTHNEKLSHLVFAASDILLVPSIFEPCGLTQMIALRYGSLPLVRKTGGLADTVFEGENGFVFLDPTSSALEDTLERALQTWKNHPEQWHTLMKKGMTSDFSWKKPAKEYFDLYQNLLTINAHL